MTLVLSYACQDFTVQVSDRRLTSLKGEVLEEMANKAVLIKPFMSFSYTGLSRMGVNRGEPTDELLMEALAERLFIGVEAAVHNLAAIATKQCRETALRGLRAEQKAEARRTSFVGAGFTRIRHGAPYRPTLCVVSNAQDLDEAWRPQADRDFAVHVAFMPAPSAGHLHVAGQPMRKAERIQLERLLRRARIKSAGPESVARLLSRAVREVSLRNSAVGPNAMCLIVRRPVIGDTAELLAGGMMPLYPEFQDEMSFFRRPSDGEHPGPDFIYSPGSPDDLEYFGPNVFSAGALFRGLKGNVDQRSQTAGPEVSFTVEARTVAPPTDRW